jgi:DNA-binding XRE family transcriptional regulator
MDGRPSKLLNETHCYIFQDKKIIFFKPLDQSDKAGTAETREWVDEQSGSETDYSTIRNKYPIKIGGRIREFRLNRRLTQVALARILNITPSALSQIESNQSLPSLQLFVTIARFFGKSLDSFFVRTPPFAKSERSPGKEKS